MLARKGILAAASLAFAACDSTPQAAEEPPGAHGLDGIWTVELITKSAVRPVRAPRQRVVRGEIAFLPHPRRMR